MKKSKENAKVKKNESFKRVSIDDAKVANVMYNFYAPEEVGYIKNGEGIVFASVVSVRFDLRNRKVTSELKGADGNMYVREGTYDMFHSVDAFNGNSPFMMDTRSTSDILHYSGDKRLMDCACVILDRNDENNTSNIYLEVWVFEDGEAVRVPVEINVVERREGFKWHMVDGSIPDEFWESREHAYRNNEYKVVDEDGKVFTERGIDLRLRPTKEQMAVINDIKNLMKKAADMNIHFAYDDDYRESVFAFNGSEVVEWGYDIDNKSAGQKIAFRDIVMMDTGISFLDYCSSDDYGIVLKPTPYQEKVWKKKHPDAK